MATKKRSIDEAAIHPDVFSVHIGCYLGKSSSAVWKDGWLECESSVRMLMLDSKKIQPSEEEWSKFWKSMERIGVWQWSGEYTNEYAVLDGTSWSVEISCGGRSILASGSNAYPESDTPDYSKVFKRFITALNKLVGMKNFFI